MFGTITEADADGDRSHRRSSQRSRGDLHDRWRRRRACPTPPTTFPTVQSNLVPLQLSLGAYNCLQQSDCHSYWELNEYTNWVFPLYEIPYTGGIAGTFEAGRIGAVLSIVPGSGPSGVTNDPVVVGDDPSNPRDPDRGQASSLTDEDRPQPPNDDHKETRTRFIPSGLANEILLDVYERLASFEPAVLDLSQRILDAYAAEVARIDENGDGIVAVRGSGSRGRVRRRAAERPTLPGCTQVQPDRRQPRDRRRHARATLRPEPARLGTERHPDDDFAGHRCLRPPRQRQPLISQSSALLGRPQEPAKQPAPARWGVGREGRRPSKAFRAPALPSGHAPPLRHHFDDGVALVPESEASVVDDLSLRFALDDEVAQVEDVHLGAREGVEGVERRLDDRLALQVEARVEDDRNAGRLDRTARSCGGRTGWSP